MSAEKPLVSVSVRDLVEFVLRRGDLGGCGSFAAPSRAWEGTRGHQRLQRSRPAGYETEVTVAERVEREEFVLQVRGRIDGVWRSDGAVLVEEIKTVDTGWEGVAEPLHWAQAKVYARLYCRAHPELGLEKVDVQLAYLELESGQVTCFRESFGIEALGAFFEEVVGEYSDWMRMEVAWQEVRDRSIQELAFPFATYRAGQRDLAVAVYRALSRGSRLYVEAPTGIGKTISVLYPAIKRLGEGGLEKAFYLTAKTVGKGVAEAACAEMRRAGLRLRSLTLTAREKICVNEGGVCDIQACPLALGYYDRLRGALREGLGLEVLTRAAVETVGRRHQVCPFELSLDLASWTDVIIADYNYVFDPRASLKRFFAEGGGDYAFLVDEAHNLVDRARAMFSAELTGAELGQVRRALGSELPGCRRALGAMERQMRGVGPEEAATDCAVARVEKPESLLAAVRRFVGEAEVWLAQNRPALFREALLECYFRATAFVRTSDFFDERYVTLADAGEAGIRVRLFCLDPSRLIREVLRRGKSSVFFSATLSPPEYYRQMLGGESEDVMVRLRSPFPEEHLCVLVGGHIGTSYKQRGATYGRVAEALAAMVLARPGNYLVYFPSYRYLGEVAERFRGQHPGVMLRMQSPGMTEQERGEFLAAFDQENTGTLVGFAVMGGVFGEGIDLVGERLVGVGVVGVGLPQLCLERDLIRDYFERLNGAGFDYAYLYPGLNRVLQAAGRVIRSETDRGVVLLIDARFGQDRYRRLFPPWWRPERVRAEEEITRRAREFWGIYDL